MYTLKQYNTNNLRIIINKCKKHKINGNRENKEVDEYECLRTAISRSKRLIREYALSNDFEYFFTSTVNSRFCDRYSIEDTQEQIRKICKSIKRKNKDFIYLFITEKHKDGAFHFHGLCSNLELYKNQYGYFSSLDFDKLGFNSFSKIKDKTKVSNYITKYITKDCIRNSKGSMYFCSKGLKKADSYEIYELPLDDYIIKAPFENEYVKIYDIEIDKLEKNELMFLFENLKSL